MLLWHCCGHGCVIEASFIGPQACLPACWCVALPVPAPAGGAASGLLHDTKQLIVPGWAATGACPAATYGQRAASGSNSNTTALCTMVQDSVAGLQGPRHQP